MSPSASNPPTIKVKQLHPAAQIPQYRAHGAVCFDLMAIDTPNAQPHPADHNARVFRTGLAFEIPEGWALELHAIPRHGACEAMRLSQGTMIVGPEDRQEVKIAIRWDGTGHRERIIDGMAVAQARLVPAPQATIVGELCREAGPL